MPPALHADDWSTRAADYLSWADGCPRCGAPAIACSCPTCGADLASPEAERVRTLSLEIADSLRRRSALIAALPAAPAATAPAAVLPEPAPLAAAPVAARSSLTLQSVMAVAGAGLLAVAAIVFSYVNPDFTDVGARALVLLVVTAVMVAGAALLVRFGLRFSGEAIGALGGVFVALDIQSVAEFTGASTSPWALGALGCVIGAALLGALGVVVRLRAWVWYAATGAIVAPALLGYSAAEPSPTLGHLGAIAVALLVPPALARLSTRMPTGLGPARVTATALRLLATAVVLLELAVAPYPVDGGGRALFCAAVLAALATGSALGGLAELPRLSATLAGLLGVAAVTVAAAALPAPSGWQVALFPAAAGAAAIAVALLPSSRIPRAWLTGGAAVAAATVALTPLASLIRIGNGLLGSATGLGGAPGSTSGIATVLGLVSVGAAAAGIWRITRRRPETERIARVAVFSGLLVVPFLGLALLTAPELPIDVAVLAGLAPAAASALLLRLWRRVAHSPLAFRQPLIVSAHLLPLLVAPVALSRHGLIVPLGAAVLLVWLLAALASPRAIRALHAVVGEVYALVVLGAALADAGVGADAAVPVVAIAAAAVGAALTLRRRVAADYQLGSVVVAAVPLGMAVLEVVEVRTGWTAGSALAGAALALVLLGTTRRRFALVRVVAAAVVVPALAVAVVCLGAQLLVVSASPVVLLVVAGLVAVALPTTGALAGVLTRRGIPSVQVRAARLAVEASALVTGAVAVLLALARVAAGPDTAFAVLVVVGIGSVATGLFARRRYGWVAAFASFTGALWTFLGIVRVGTPEAYVLPPALTAAVIGLVLVARGRPVRPACALFATGLALAPLPGLGVLALAGDGTPGPVPWRLVGLLAGSVLLSAAAVALARASGRWMRLRPLRPALLGVAILAATAGPVQGVRFGRWLDPTALGLTSLVVWPALGVGLLGTAAAAAAGLLLARDRPAAVGSGLARRWFLLPALVDLIAGPISATHRGWAPIWILWTLALLLLALMVAVAARTGRRPGILPPVWALFVLAWITAVAGWSMRDLRVEAFSLPLGVALLAVGVVGMRAQNLPAVPLRRRTLDSWPHGFRGSWWLLAPGIVVTLLPSMLATGTDPQTWRAIIVLALALGSILVGSLRRLAAPFVLGLAALPVENAIVFGAQLGREISATSWWISLATAGAVLLVIAVTSERRSGRGRGIAARMRDLG